MPFLLILKLRNIIIEREGTEYHWVFRSNEHI